MKFRNLIGIMIGAVWLISASAGLAQTIEDELTFEERPVRLIFPGDFDPATSPPMPLILHLHGAVGLPEIADAELDNSGYRALPSQHQVMVAAPRGIFHPVLEVYFWNDLVASGEHLYDFEYPDDVGFLNRLLDQLIAAYPVDPQRIYIYGYSNGASMAHRMACDASERIAAIAAGAGFIPTNALEGDECTPTAPVSVLNFHSRSDEVVLFNGGNFSASIFGVTPDDPLLDYAGAIESTVRWAALNGCLGVLKFGAEATLDLDTEAEGLETTINSVTRCPEGIDVELWSMEGVSHPPLSFGLAPSGLKTLAEESWTFLQAHTRGEAMINE